jgi:hypothetical protein
MWVVVPATAVLWSSFMARMVKCIKLGREAEGFDFPPYPGELGKLQGAPRLTSRKPGISDPPSVGTVVLLRRAHLQSF